MTGKRKLEDPLLVWRRVIRNRMQWQTMLRGSYKYATPAQFVINEQIHREPEAFGPPIPEPM